MDLLIPFILVTKMVQSIDRLLQKNKFNNTFEK